MIGGKVSDDVIDAIAFIEMHRQETEKESGSAAACAQALPKLQELLEQLTAESTEPPDIHAANVAAVTNDIARVKRFSGGGQGGGNKHQRPGQKKQVPRQHSQGRGQGGHAQGGHASGVQTHGGQGGGPAGGQGHGPNQGRGPNQGQGRRRGRNKRRGGGGSGAGGGNAGGAAGGGPRGAE